MGSRGPYWESLRALDDLNSAGLGLRHVILGGSFYRRYLSKGCCDLDKGKKVCREKLTNDFFRTVDRQNATLGRHETLEQSDWFRRRREMGQ